MNPINDHYGWAIWQHIDSEDVVLVFQVHGAVTNAALLTHPSIFRFDEDLVARIEDNLTAFTVLWQETTP